MCHGANGRTNNIHIGERVFACGLAANFASVNVALVEIFRTFFASIRRFFSSTIQRLFIKSSSIKICLSRWGVSSPLKFSFLSVLHSGKSFHQSSFKNTFLIIMTFCLYVSLATGLPPYLSVCLSLCVPHGHLRRLDWLMAHIACLVCLGSTVSGHSKYAFGRGSPSSMHITKLVQSTFSIDIYSLPVCLSFPRLTAKWSRQSIRLSVSPACHSVNMSVSLTLCVCLFVLCLKIHW